MLYDDISTDNELLQDIKFQLNKILEAQDIFAVQLMDIQNDIKLIKQSSGCSRGQAESYQDFLDRIEANKTPGR